MHVTKCNDGIIILNKWLFETNKLTLNSDKNKLLKTSYSQVNLFWSTHTVWKKNQWQEQLNFPLKNHM